MTDKLDELVEMSRSLGDPICDYVILGEGNTSADLGDGTFWVKASGAQLAYVDRDSFVRVRSQSVLAALGQDSLSDRQVSQLLRKASVEGDRNPSIETFLHALCLQLEDVNFVGHTHPTSAVALLSSQRSRELFAGSLFPDQIVLLGKSYVLVPYCDPGMPLARAVHEGIQSFVERESQSPKLILMENHGVIALGTTATQVVNVTQMLDKTCRILAGTLGAGGPRFLTPEQVERIEQRPDERARRLDLL
jgi:rhamnose utilization protein RhaD (predicted bifunctional aldolase and dehydrogenase)